MKHKGRFGIYIHWPFCLAKCPYCDFNSYVHKSIDHGLWKESYLAAIDYYAEQISGRYVGSIYFGGGTPSLMEPATVAAIIDRVQKKWNFSNDVEITLEANPTSVESEKLQNFKIAGVNRVSLGVQALNDHDLKFLGRQHNVEEALRALEVTKEIFSRYSFDLIYSRPKQTLKEWQDELERALAYSGGHLSLYQLTIERGTQFYQDYARKKFFMPGEELAADFYTLTQDILEGHGLPAYEVSNHASPGEESRHNLLYWHYDDYIGIGPGAHGRLTIDGKKYAVREHRAPEIWLNKVKEKGCGAHPCEAISQESQFMEALMMGLRLREGVSLSQLDACWRNYIDQDHMASAEKEGWLVCNEDNIRLTREGVLRLNAMVPYLLRVQPDQLKATKAR